MASNTLTWYKLKGNDTSGLSGEPAPGYQWVTHIVNGQIYYAIAPTGMAPAKVKAQYPKNWKSVTALDPTQASANMVTQSGGSSNQFLGTGGKVTMPNWQELANQYGITGSLPASLLATSNKSVNITSGSTISGSNSNVETNLFNTLQTLAVDKSTNTTSAAAKNLIADYFSYITGNSQAGSVILANWDGAKPNSTDVANLNALMKATVKVLDAPAYQGNLGAVQQGALTYTGGVGSKATVVVNPIGTNGAPTAGGGNLYGISSASGSTQVNALTAIEQELANWGMDSGSLVTKIKNLVLKEGDHVVTTGQLNDFIRSQPEYEQAFPGLQKYNMNAAKMGMKPITENAYLALQDSYTNTARNFDLPAGFLTTKEIGNLVEGGVSAKEFEDRIMMGYNAARNADPQTRAILQQQYGLSQGDLTAYFLNPKTAESTLTNRMASASLQGYAKNVGLDMSQAGGESLANMIRSSSAIGTASGAAVQNPYATVTLQSAESAISKAAQDAQLQKNLPGSNMPTVSADQQIGAQIAGYMGTNQAAEQAQVGRAEQARVAPFEKGGGYAETAKGVTGLGSARQ